MLNNNEIENENYVICKICHKKMGSISPPHLKYKHNMTIKDYKEKFPDAVLQSADATRKRRNKNLGRKVTWANKISRSNKISWQKNPNQGRTGKSLSEKARKKLSNKLSGHEVSDETKIKIGAAGMGRDPWNKGLTKETDSRLMDISKKITEYNKNMPQETRNKIAQTLKKKYRDGMKISNAKTGLRKDLGMSFRSTWEANYARLLLYKNKDIIYEKDRFSLYKDDKMKCVYVTDFKIGEKEYIEIKGHAFSNEKWTCNCKRCIRDKEKMRLLKDQYPDIKMKIIGKKEYKEIYDKYEYIIPNWEKSKGEIIFSPKKYKQKIRICSYTFNKPNFYFDDISCLSPENIQGVGESIEARLEQIYDIINILTKNGWDWEFSDGDVDFYRKDFPWKTEEEVKKYLIGLGMNFNCISIEHIR